GLGGGGVRAYPGEGREARSGCGVEGGGAGGRARPRPGRLPDPPAWARGFPAEAAADVTRLASKLRCPARLAGYPSIPSRPVAWRRRLVPSGGRKRRGGQPSAFARRSGPGQRRKGGRAGCENLERHPHPVDRRQKHRLSDDYAGGPSPPNVTDLALPLPDPPTPPLPP